MWKTGSSGQRRRLSRADRGRAVLGDQPWVISATVGDLQLQITKLQTGSVSLFAVIMEAYLARHGRSQGR
jgi:hypothetical protein